MTTEARTLLHTFEGPKGKAEVFELVDSADTTGSKTEYEVICGSQQQRVAALGHACILAQEFAGL